jgi:hypothetical protein
LQFCAIVIISMLLTSACFKIIRRIKAVLVLFGNAVP